MAQRSIFKPTHPEKYVGNVNNIVCRSSWERRVCLMLDSEDNVINWSSEELVIKYVNPVKRRLARYFPDFLVTVKQKDGTQKVIVIEVKPDKETRPPIKKIKVTKRYIRECATYATNQSKWKAAVEFCKDHKMTFQIITEKDLGLK